MQLRQLSVQEQAVQRMTIKVRKALPHPSHPQKYQRKKARMILNRQAKPKKARLSLLRRARLTPARKTMRNPQRRTPGNLLRKAQRNQFRKVMQIPMRHLRKKTQMMRQIISLWEHGNGISAEITAELSSIPTVQLSIRMSTVIPHLQDGQLKTESFASVQQAVFSS